MNVNPINKHEQWELLVLLLKEISEQKNITQQKIADISGMQRSHINRFFTLKYCPTLETFLKIAKAIGIDFCIEK